MKRFLKQIVVAAVFFIIIGLIVYFSFIKDDSVEPLSVQSFFIPSPEVISQNFFKVGNFDYDFLVTIKNPNIDFGASSVFYEVSIFARDGNLVNVLSGSTNLLPGQTRHEIISSIKASDEISNIIFKITNVEWQKLKEYIPQTLFLVKNQEYSPSSQFPILKATLFNNSNFDFDRVDVYIILFGDNDKVLAVNKTDIRTFIARTDRFFEVRWLKPLEGQVRRVEINAYTDVFKNENFIKQHGTQENFQKFY